MSHRTEDLPPLTGLPHLIRELRYHEGARQGLAIVLILLYAVTAEPSPLLTAIGLPWPSRRFRKPLRQRFHREEPRARDRRRVSLRAPSPLHGQHPARRRLRARRLALVGDTGALFFFWFYYPTAIEYEDRKLHRMFGTAWEQWSARTPALMPRVGGETPRTRGSALVARRQHQRNGELVLIAFELGGAGGWRGTHSVETARARD